MALVKIDNHVELAEKRIPSEYKNAVNYKAFINAIVSGIQHLEDETFNVYTNRGLSTAVGKQLDGIGEIVGEDRNGRNDDDYRYAIIAQIEINNAGGDPEAIINAITKLVNPINIEYKDLYPANFQLFIQTDSFINNFRDIIDSLTPAGVGEYVLEVGSENDPLTFVEVSNQVSNYATDTSGTLLQVTPTDNLDVSVVVVSDDDDFFDDGFAEVYLNKQFYSVNDAGDLYDIGDGQFLEFKLTNANEDYYISDFGGEFVEVIT